MLGRISRESAVHAWRAAQDAGWVSDETGLLDLGSTTATLSTVGSISHLGAVMHIGHPSRPDPALERALLSSPPGVHVTDAHSVDATWVLAANVAQPSGNTVVDEAGMRDCRHQLRALGVMPHLVPTTMPLEQRISLAGSDGMIVIEQDRVPDGFEVVAGSQQLAHHPVWFGHISHVEQPDFTEPARIWLAFGPSEDRRGSLHSVLGTISDSGFDLVHLRSHPTSNGPHVFFTAFNCDQAEHLSSLLAAFDRIEVRYRVLGVLPVFDEAHDPSAVEPVWHTN